MHLFLIISASLCAAAAGYFQSENSRLRRDLASKQFALDFAQREINGRVLKSAEFRPPVHHSDGSVFMERK